MTVKEQEKQIDDTNKGVGICIEDREVIKQIFDLLDKGIHLSLKHETGRQEDKYPELVIVKFETTYK